MKLSASLNTRRSRGVAGSQQVVHWALAALVSGTSVLASAAPAAATPPAAATVTPQEVIASFEGTFGVHPGQRRNHIKGTCAAGEFVGTPEAAALSRSTVFSGKPIDRKSVV